MSEWWERNSNIPWNDNDFQNILNFFLFNCPSEIEHGSKKKGTLKYEKVSKRAITLRQQGWSGGHLHSLLASMKHTTSGHLEYRKCSSKDDVKATTLAIEVGTSLKDDHFEMVVVQERSDMNLTSATFYYIRNAFAHGAFSVVGTGNTTTYYLESAKDGEVKARIRLREQTLLKWITDFKLSPKALKIDLSKGRNERKKQKRNEDAA